MRSLIGFTDKVLQKRSMGSEMVQFVGALDPAGAQDFDFGQLSNIVAYEGARDSIIKKLFLNWKDILGELQMVGDHAEGVLVDVYM